MLRIVVGSSSNPPCVVLALADVGVAQACTLASLSLPILHAEQRRTYAVFE
jgi:hypothetical protein